jgi:hypothetical protein
LSQGCHQGSPVRSSFSFPLSMVSGLRLESRIEGVEL